MVRIEAMAVNYKKLRQCRMAPQTAARLLQERSTKGDQAIFYKAALWPNGHTLDVQFVDTPQVWQTWQKAWIAKVVTENNMVYANINFTFHLDNSTLPHNKTCEIRITCDPNSGCYSAIGSESANLSFFPNESMNYGWMDAPLNTAFTYNGVSYHTDANFEQGGYEGYGGTIMHEFGHALGMMHELETPYNNPIVWNTSAVYAYFEGPPNNWSKADVDNNVLNPIQASTVNGSDFDVNSIMKYSMPSSLLLNPSAVAATDIQQVNDRTLSGCDQYWLAANYPGRNVTVSCSLASHQLSTVPHAPTSPPPVFPPPGPPPVTKGLSVGAWIGVSIAIFVTLYLIYFAYVNYY